MFNPKLSLLLRTGVTVLAAITMSQVYSIDCSICLCDSCVTLSKKVSIAQLHGPVLTQQSDIR